MIKLIDKLPKKDGNISAEQLKIYLTFDSYSDIGLFWVQNEGDCLISMLDGNMVIYNLSADIEELREFIKVISPSSIFSNKQTLLDLKLKNIEEASVLSLFCGGEIEEKGDLLSSREIYDILNVKELLLPKYDYFAVDFCHRLNHGKANYFGIRGICAAVSFEYENEFLLNGIASQKKGFGSIALKGIISKNISKTAIVCAKKDVLKFYKKNGFEFLYEVGYWMG